MKLLDRLGDWLLAIIMFVFVPRTARRRMRKDARNAVTTSADREPTARKALIAKAISLHRQRQDALSELDEESRNKLSIMARRMLPAPQTEQKHKPKKQKSGPEA